MGAHPVPMSISEQAVYHCIMWLEHAYNDEVMVLDVDFETGRVTLYGEPERTKEFNKQLEAMCAAVYDPMEAWRSISFCE